MKAQKSSWTGSEPALELTVRFCPVLAGLILSVHALAGGVMLSLSGWGWSGLCLVLATGFSMFACLGASGLTHFRRGPAWARWHEDGTWTLVDHGRRSLAAGLDAGGVCLPHFVALSWRTDDGRRLYVMLIPARDDRETLRRLRARMRRMDPA